MENLNVRKLAFFVNTLILIFVLGLWGFFAMEQAKIMVVFSAPTVVVYFVNYVLIAKERYDWFIWLTYFWILIYMSLATLSLGMNYGFHLYCMSLIPVIFCTEYLSYRLRTHSIRALYIGVIIGIFYLVVTGYVVHFGSIYQHPADIMTNVFLAVNAIIVFGFLISYSYLLVSMVIASEEQLREMALKDKLTKLYNRHYAMDELNRILENGKGKHWISMIDIDNFKKFNDEYGHDCGDYVLVHLSELMCHCCGGCLVSRWGGEEFLIASQLQNVSIDKLENLRQVVQQEEFVYNDKKLSVTITIGGAWYEEGMSLDKWIQRADEQLYKGKTSGKNKVVI